MADDDDLTPPRGKRARSHWGDEQRAEVGRDRRTPALGVPHELALETTQRHGVPSVERDRDQFTPISHILDTIADPDLRRVARLIWEHTANVEMRSQQRIGDDAVRTEVDALGKSVRTLLSRAWWLFTVLVGAVGAAAIKLIVVGRAYGEMDAQLQSTKERVQLLENALFLRNRVVIPALPPGKDPQ